MTYLLGEPVTLAVNDKVFGGERLNTKPRGPP
jgi:hypothetical protein